MENAWLGGWLCFRTGTMHGVLRQMAPLPMCTTQLIKQRYAAIQQVEALLESKQEKA
jgi:hypothetical protein